MTLLKKFFIFVLCFVLFAQSFPVAASESGFISFKVVGMEEGQKHLYEEVGYSDGKHLYVSVDFLTSYMPYTYDEESQSFIRINHDSKSLFGRVILDATGKTAALHMNGFSKKTYLLEDVYCFGDQIFLPLDQMAALLKARIFEENDNGEKIIAIACCLNSLSDAEYAFSKIMNKKYLFYGYTEILDDIFYGDETIFKSASVLSYFSSTIYGMQLKNLDIIFHSGDVDIYKNFVSNCLFDNEDYLNVFTNSDSLCYRFNDVLNLTKPLKKSSDVFDDFLSNINEVIEPYKDLNIENGALYIDTRDWGAVFNTLSTVLEWANFVMQFASMNQDNSMAIKNYVNYMNGNTSTEDTVLKAMRQVLEIFGEDFVNASVDELLDCVGDKILEETTKEALRLAFEKLEVVKIAIKVINAVAKHFGFDLADNTNYSILKENEVKNAFQDYWLSLPDNHFESETDSEEYRQSAILCLLSSKHLFESANKLNEKYNENSTYYDDRIELLSTVAGMFYLAVEGKGFDDFAGVDELIGKNHTTIVNCDIISAFSFITENDALQHKCKKTLCKVEDKPPLMNLQTDNYSWEGKAQDFLFNLPKYVDLSDVMLSDYLSFELIDINLDGSPEILLYFISGGGGGKGLVCYAHFNGQEYVARFPDDNSRVPSNYIYPYFDAESQSYVFISGLRSEEDFNYALDNHPYSSGWFWRGFWYQEFWSFANKTLSSGDMIAVDEIDGFNKIFNSNEYSDEEQNEALNNLKQHYRKMNERYVECDLHYCITTISANGVRESGYILSAYHEEMPERYAKRIVEQYVLGVNDVIDM